MLENATVNVVVGRVRFRYRKLGKRLTFGRLLRII